MTDLRTLIFNKKASAKRSWWLRSRATGGRPLWGRALHTSEYGARLSSVSSGDRSVTPAILGASRHSNLQRVLLLASTQKHSSPESLATSKNILTTDRSAVFCRVSIWGHQTSSSEHPRGQSQETGSLSTFSGSVETSAKCISMGPAHCRKRVQDSVRISPASVQRDISHPGGPRAGSVNGRMPSRWSLLTTQSPGSTAVTSSFRKRMEVCVQFSI